MVVEPWFFGVMDSPIESNSIEVVFGIRYWYKGIFFGFYISQYEDV